MIAYDEGGGAVAGVVMDVTEVIEAARLVDNNNVIRAKARAEANGNPQHWLRYLPMDQLRLHDALVLMGKAS